MAKKRTKKKKTAHAHRGRGLNWIEIIPGSNGNPPTVDQPEAHVSKSKKDHVKWWTRNSKDWAVVFDGPTPFELHCFSPGTPGNQDIPGAEKSYKYSIFIDGQSADPVIIVGR